MSVFVSCCFLLDAFLESLGDVDACLIGDAAEYPEDVGNLFFLIVFLSGLETLVSILASHDAGEFTHLFREDRHVSEFREISHAVSLDPLVNGFLCFFDGHVSLLCSGRPKWRPPSLISAKIRFYFCIALFLLCLSSSKLSIFHSLNVSIFHSLKVSIMIAHNGLPHDCAQWCTP